MPTTSRYLNQYGISVEWHYVDIKQPQWQKMIEARNEKIRDGNGGSDFYVDEGLMNKLLSEFEEPTKSEIDVWFENNE